MHEKATGDLPHGIGWLPWVSVALALLLAAYDLSRAHLPKLIAASVERVRSGPFEWLDKAHSGLIGDYVTWIVVGLALLAGRLMLA